MCSLSVHFKLISTWYRCACVCLCRYNSPWQRIFLLVACFNCIFHLIRHQRRRTTHIILNQFSCHRYTTNVVVHLLVGKFHTLRRVAQKIPNPRQNKTHVLMIQDAISIAYHSPHPPCAIIYDFGDFRQLIGIRWKNLSVQYFVFRRNEFFLPTPTPSPLGWYCVDGGGLWPRDTTHVEC